MQLKTKRLDLLLLAFLLMTLLQLLVPAHMIYQQEDILKTGASYKMKLAPVDPYDYFRGKYLHINYLQNSLILDEMMDAKSNMRGREITVYAVFAEDSDNFLILQSISKERPAKDKIYVKAKMRYYTHKDNLACSKSYLNHNSKKTFLKGCTLIYLYYYNDRFYMNEEKIKLVQAGLNRMLGDSSSLTRESLTKEQQELMQPYVKWRIKDGQVSLENLYLNDKPIEEFFKSQLLQNKD